MIGTIGSALGGSFGGPIGAAIGGALAGGLFGGRGGGGTGMSQQAIAEARKRAAEASFRPYTVTTSTGTTQYDPSTGFSTTLSDPFQNILGTSLTGAGSLFEQAATFDPTRRAQEVFTEQEELLKPAFAQQATQLQSQLFGGGRLGLRLSGESQGLGAGSGMVQPDALGLGQAQQQTLANLAAQSRAQAFQEQAQLQNLATGMLGAGMSISDLERGLMAQGLDAETARAAAAYGAGNLALAPYNTAVDAQAQAQANRYGLFGGFGASLLSNPGLFGRPSAQTTSLISRAIPVPDVSGYTLGAL